MPTSIEPAAPTKVAQIDLRPRGVVFPSPRDWRDEILYFLLPDRFSDEREEQRPRFDRAAPQQYAADDKAKWMQAGRSFNGGTIRGITSKLPYLKGLGITALWIAPVFKNRFDLPTYHGYSIQDFLEIDPRFGSRQELRDMVDAAHAQGLRVLFDIVYNHSGNNWFYDQDGTPVNSVPFRRDEPYLFHSWRATTGSSTPTIGDRGDGVWPVELQDPEVYTRLGRIVDFEPPAGSDPQADDQEFRLGDFADQKDIDLSRDEVLNTMIAVYRYWIAVTDCDGYRIENFAKGFAAPAEYFSQYTGVDDLGSHRRLGRYHISVLDDHDMVNKGGFKYRFGASGDFPAKFEQIALAVGLQLTTLGIPCIYYGTEQGFDGTQARHDFAIEPLNPDGILEHNDRYVRENMFGGEFGAFETRECHFFDPMHPVYLRIGAIARVRQQKNGTGLALRRGRQYLRQVDTGGGWREPNGGEVIGWSRILFQTEALVLTNTHGGQARRAWVQVGVLAAAAQQLRVLYRSDWPDSTLSSTAVLPVQNVPVQIHNGSPAIDVQLGPAGMLILSL